MPQPIPKWLTGRGAALKRRPGRVLAILTCLIIAAGIGWQLWPEDWSYPQLRPAVDAAPASIIVGDNVHVSKSHEKIPFRECIIIADPGRPSRLFASSIYSPQGDESLVGYLSDDGGSTWTTNLELIANRGKKEGLYDETAAFGPDGEIYYVHMRHDEESRKKRAYSLDWLCLPAGAATWETRGRIDRYFGLDRPWLAVDNTKGPHRGQLYCTASIGPTFFITSRDGGRTFQFPKVPYSIENGPYPAQPVVLSDGSVLAACRSNRGFAPQYKPQHIETFISIDGGQSLTTGPFVSNWKHPSLKRRWSPDNVLQGSLPQMAVDPGSPRFADHLYIVWSQGFDNRSNTEWILFSRSTDRGKSWSAPVNLSEQRDTDNPTHDYVAYIPCIAVNKDGIVAATWYDRRGLPPPDSDASMKGWHLRMRVSLDGGATWAPSVAITSKPSSGKLTGQDTAGLTADATGRFHPAWIDDRTGMAQLWTASVTVKSPGTAVDR